MSFRILTVLAVCLIVGGLLSAADLTIKKAGTTPVIDAEKDGIWDMVEPQTEFFVVEGDNFIDDEVDCAPSFRMLWDETYLYYYIEILDSYLNVDEDPADLTNFANGGWGWADDVVEIY